MKITIEIDTENDGDLEEAVTMLRAQDMSALLHVLAEEMRMAAKHHEDDGAARWRQRLYEIALEAGVEIA